MHSEIFAKAQDYSDNWVQWLDNNQGRINGAKTGVVEIVVLAAAAFGGALENLVMVVAHVAGKVISCVGWVLGQYSWFGTSSLVKAWMHLNLGLEQGAIACVKLPMCCFNVPGIIVLRLWDPSFRFQKPEPGYDGILFSPTKSPQSDPSHLKPRTKKPAATPS